jgi:lactate permease
MYRQVLDPVGDSLGLSTLVAVLPLVTLFVLLGIVRTKAYVAGIAALVVALLVAIVAYGMPVGQGLLSASEGAVFGFFPILWIVINAIWIYNMTVARGTSRCCGGRSAGSPTTSASRRSSWRSASGR